MGFQKGELFRFTRTKKLIKLFVGFVKKMFSPLSKIINDIASDYSEQSSLKKTWIGLFKLRYVILFSVLLVVLCAGHFFASQNDRESSAIMSLNYEEGAKGLNPNSTRFNVYEIKSPEVVEKMLYYCGIDSEKIDLDKVIDSITISPTNSKGFKIDDYYIATSYRITVKKNPQIKEVCTRDLLTYLCKAYTDIFYERYADNRAILDFDVNEFDDLEFLLAADLMDIKVQQQSKYLSTRAKQNKTFSDESLNETFKSLYEKLEDFQNYDIERYRSYILQTGIARDKVHYIRVLDYVNLVNYLKYSKSMASYDATYEGVAIYNDKLINTIMIPTIDYVNGSYYMSKTKTGMDYIASQADDFLVEAQASSQKIETNKNIISKLQSGENKTEDIEKANKMIADMQVKFSEIGRQIELLDKSYIKYKTKDYITFQIKGMSLRQRLRLDFLFELAVILMLCAFVALWIKFRYFDGGVKK